MSAEWRPKLYRRRNEHRIWYGNATNKWYVNYCDDDIFGDFNTWAEAFEYLSEELAKCAST